MSCQPARVYGAVMTAILLVWLPQASASIRECRQLFLTGQYAECRKMAQDAMDRRAYGEDWPVLKLRAERELGRRDAALATALTGIQRYPWSVRLHWEACLDYRESGQQESAARALREIDRLASATPWRYSDADDLVALGRAALAAGADPKDVLQGFFERARRNFSRRSDGVLASAELALEKGDAAFAVELLTPAIETFDRDPQVLWAHSRALWDADPEAAEASRLAALEINPHFAPALLAAARRSIDREQYEEALTAVSEVRQFNPFHAEACGLLMAIHLLNGADDRAAQARVAGQVHNPFNPMPDHYAGVILSRRYRFAEGAALQRRALQLNADLLPAKVQLAQDLLRLGARDEGWELADAAHQQDGYDTELFNLLQLRDSLDRFAVLRNERFIVYMPRAEARVFGDQVMGLLNDAWETLTVRYGYVPAEPVIVEIFDHPEDFAVRTFGLPDVGGFLGVCFGRVITANSPTSRRQRPINWESVLWHEFCHVITLQMTDSRIPRWLSEGISVCEERRRDARCGQRMSPAFRDRILKQRITPVSRLSSAFLDAESGEDINFAYFESSMVVEFLAEQYGDDCLKAVLLDLNRGLQINDALVRHSTDLDALNGEFEQWLRGQAEAFAPEVEFDTELLAGVTNLEEFCEEFPGHFPAGLARARQLVPSDPEAAEAELLRLLQLFPQDQSAQGVRPALASLYRQQERYDDERDILQEHLTVTADDADAARRLLELHCRQQNWAQALAVGKQVLAIDPMRADVLRPLALAAERTPDSVMAVRCLTGLLELDASQAPGLRLRIARLLQTADPQQSRRHVLLALEEAPRFREAHRLLLELTVSDDGSSVETVPDSPLSKTK